jgi:hypothetical protein
MPLMVKKDEFLSCASNKQRFLYELLKKFDQKHFNFIHASGDANVLIAKTAIRLSEDHVTDLVGDHTFNASIICPSLLSCSSFQ